MIAIVGGGAAGLSAAETLRELGYRGPLRMFGAERALPYERPVLSKGYLVDRRLDEPPALQSAARLAELGIRFDAGVEVLRIDPARRTIDTARDEHVCYELLLLAPGAAPRRLGIPGEELRGVHRLRELDDARALRAALGPGRELVIVGGGVIGLEIAASARALGASVTVIETAPRLMGRVVPDACAHVIEQHHRARGVVVRTATRPVAFEGRLGVVCGVMLDGGERISADLVVVGVGAIPRTDLAASAGLAVDDGIVVDELMRSSDEGIFAAGDAARLWHSAEARSVRIEQWRPAQDQGRHAAASMLGAREPYRAIPSMWSDQDDLHLQATGFGFGDAQVVSRGDLGDRSGVAFFGVRDDRLVAACAVSLGTGAARMVRAARELIECGMPLSAEQLDDPGVDLRRLARSGRSHA